MDDRGRRLNRVSVGEDVTVFGQRVKHLAIRMAGYRCRMCEAHVLTKHIVAIFRRTATKQRWLFQKSETFSTFKCV